MKPVPGLFAQDHNNSSRDYTKEDSWGKNQFNSSFPASLVAWMSYKDIRPVYLTMDEDNQMRHDYISGSELYRIDPLSKFAYYNFEAGFSGFEKFYTGMREKIDLVMMDSRTNENLIGLEIKLTAIPDSTTKRLPEDKYSCEIVVRPPTINFLACSICNCFQGREGRNELKNILGKVPQINHWEDIQDVLPHYPAIRDAVLNVCGSIIDRQVPLMVQPVWKTNGAKPILATDCLDVFVWSNLAILLACLRQQADPKAINRYMRTVIWIYRMLFDYSIYEQFDYRRIVRLHSYNIANDKAFALSGTQTYPLLKCEELAHPRISKYDIRHIILGGGQNLLSPERRFDAAIVANQYLFEDEDR